MRGREGGRTRERETETPGPQTLNAHSVSFNCGLFKKIVRSVYSTPSLLEGGCGWEALMPVAPLRENASILICVSAIQMEVFILRLST